MKTVTRPQSKLRPAVGTTECIYLQAGKYTGQFVVEITGLSSSRVSTLEDAVTRPQPKLRPAVGCIYGKYIHRFRHSQFVVEITGLSSSRVSTLEDACEDSYTPTPKLRPAVGTTECLAPQKSYRSSRPSSSM